MKHKLEIGLMSLFLLTPVLTACGSSPVKDDVSRLRRIHLMGVVFIGPNVLTQNWSLDEVKMTRDIQNRQKTAMPGLVKLTDNLGIDPSKKRNVQGDVSITRSSRINDDVATYNKTVTGTCNNCKNDRIIRISATGMKVAAARKMEELLRNNPNSPFSPVNETRKLVGYYAAKRFLDQKYNSQKDFPDPEKAQQAYGLVVRGDTYREMMRQNPDDGFVVVQIHMRPRTVVKSTDASGSHMDPFYSYKMTLTTDAGWGSYYLSNQPTADMRYTIKPETNLFHPPGQTCLPVILNVSDFNTTVVNFRQSSPLRIQSVDWVGIARRNDTGALFQVSGGSTATLNYSAGLQKALLEKVPEMTTSLLEATNYYLNDLRD